MSESRPLVVADDVTLIRPLPPEGDRPAISSLVLGGDEPVLVDTTARVGRDEWWRQVEHVVDPDDVRWIFLSHEDIDHSGNLDEALERCPRAVLVTNPMTAQRLSVGHALPAARCRWIDDGDVLLAGRRELVALRPPAYDTPSTRGLFDVTSGVYWAADCFGVTVAHQVDDASQLDHDVWLDGFSRHHRLLSPWATQVDPVRWRAAIGRVAALDPSAIASAHGPLVRRPDIARALDVLGELPGLPEVRLPAHG